MLKKSTCYQVTSCNPEIVHGHNIILVHISTFHNKVKNWARIINSSMILNMMCIAQEKKSRKLSDTCNDNLISSTFIFASCALCKPWPMLGHSTSSQLLYTYKAFTQNKRWFGNLIICPHETLKLKMRYSICTTTCSILAYLQYP